MYRSASWTRVSPDEYNFIQYSSTSPTSASSMMRMASSTMMEVNKEGLPTYEPVSQGSRREKTYNKFAEDAVHVIPLVLLICGLVLWLFSNPDVDVGMKGGDSIAAKIEGLTIEGDIDNDSDGTQTGFLPIDASDLDSPKQRRYGNGKRSRKLFVYTSIF